MSNCYFETLGAAVRQFLANLADKGAVLAKDESEVASAFDGGVSYGQTVSRSFELVSLKGKATKKGAHVSLYRMESGRYELTDYVL